MKKITRYFAAAAAAVLAIVSCNKNEISAPETGKTRIVIGAKPEEAVESTKTYIEEDTTTPAPVYHAKWSNSGEQLGIFFWNDDNPLKKDKLITLSAEDTTDNDPIFTGEATIDDGTYNMFIFYPRSAFHDIFSDGTIGVNLKATQHPVAGSFDPTCDLMGWSTNDATIENGSYVLEGKTLIRPMAILRVNLNAPTGGGKVISEADQIGKVTGFKMEVAEDSSSEDEVFLTGRAKISTLGQITAWTIKNNYVQASISASELITIGDNDGFQSLYFVVNPTTIPAGRAINFTVETENYSGVNAITRTVTAPAAMPLEAGKVNIINLTIRDKDFPGEIVNEDYSGEYLMAGTKNNATYAALKFSSGSNLKATAKLIFSNDGSTISCEDGVNINDTKMTFTKITEGDYKNMYTIQDANGKYLYAASSSGNQLKVQDEPDINGYWTVFEEEGGTYSIVASKSSNRNVLQFNPNNTNDALVSCYSAEDLNNRQNVTLYPWDMVSTDTPPVEETTISTILADATITADNSVNYEVDGVTVMAAQGRNYVIADATGVMLLYAPSGTTLTVGNQYKVSGGVKLFNGVHEYTGTLTITPSTGTAPAYGTPEEMTVASLTAYKSAPVTKFAVVSATAEASGYLCSDGTNTINVYDGTGTWSQFYGKQVKVTGYLIGYKSGNSPQINMIATAIEDASNPEAPTLSVSPESLSWAANEYGPSSAKTITVTLNAGVSSDNYFVNGDDDDWDISNGDDIITIYPKTANTGASAKTFTFEVAHADDESVSKTVTCTQTAPAVSISTILADNTITTSNAVNYEVDGVTVMAAKSGNYVIADATGIMLLYTTSSLTVGSQYKVNGDVKIFNGVHEFTNSPKVTASTGTAPAAGTPEEMTVASLTAYKSAPVTKYAVVSATAEASGYLCSDGTNTINVYDGTGTWSQFYGKQVKVTGYLIGFKSSNSQINMIATAIEDITPADAATLSLSSTSLDWAYNETGMKQILVTQNDGASGFTLSYTASNDWLVQYTDGNNYFKVNPTGTNNGSSSKVLTINVIHKDDATVYETLTLTQKPAGGTTYTKVTSAPSDWSGTYLIVYETSATSGFVCLAGTDAYHNYDSAVIASGVISSESLTDYEVSISAYSTGYSIKALGGANKNKYLEGKGNSNGTSFVASPSYVTTLALSGGEVTITNNTDLFVYNSTAGTNGERWRFYKSTTVSQKPETYIKPALYKKN